MYYPLKPFYSCREIVIPVGERFPWERTYFLALRNPLGRSRLSILIHPENFHLSLFSIYSLIIEKQQWMDRHLFEVRFPKTTKTTSRSQTCFKRYGQLDSSNDRAEMANLTWRSFNHCHWRSIICLPTKFPRLSKFQCRQSEISLSQWRTYALRALFS